MKMPKLYLLRKFFHRRSIMHQPLGWAFVLFDRAGMTSIAWGLLTGFLMYELVEGALQAGAIGFLFKDVSIDQLADAIRAAKVGKATLAPEATEALLDAVTQPAPPGQDLTPRELDVLALMVEGLNNPEIAERLGVSRSTVKTHVSNILSKLGVASRLEAVTLALQHKLLVT